MKQKIILFGTGSSSEKIKNIIDYTTCEIVGYADNNAKKQGTYMNGIYIYEPSELPKVAFDFIIIGSIYFDEIYAQLIALNIRTEKIVNVYEYIRYYDVALKLADVENKTADILITGISYSRYGFDEATLKYPSVNLSFNSQDLFYDYCLAYNYLKNHDVKYVLIGLCYYDFQFDLSLSKEKHLVNRYKVIADVQQEIDASRYEKIVRPLLKQDIQPLNSLAHIFVPNFVERFDTLLQQQVPGKNLDAAREALAKTHSSKNYPATLEDNKQIFNRYLRLLKQKNIQPIVVVHPQEKAYRAHFNKEMIKEFYEIIQISQQQFDLTFIDLFADDRFDEQDFYDVHHLNQQGAQKVSRIVNEFI